MPNLSETVHAYKQKFGEVPPLAGLSGDILNHAVQLLADAVEYDIEIETGEFYEMLGIDPPPKDADT